MGLLITKTDFADTFALSISISDKITAYIAMYEEKYLRELLGASLFTLFKSDVTNYLPVTAKYLTIFNEINSDEDNFLLHSDGMKKMIKGFIWYEFVAGTAHKHTSTGVVADVNEISLNANFDLAFKHYNESIDTYNAIQYYITDNNTNYTDFAGVSKRFISSF